MNADDIKRAKAIGENRINQQRLSIQQIERDVADCDAMLDVIEYAKKKEYDISIEKFTRAKG